MSSFHPMSTFGMRKLVLFGECHSSVSCNVSIVHKEYISNQRGRESIESRQNVGSKDLFLLLNFKKSARSAIYPQTGLC